jgi:Mg2+ and Co2+ transporter CorA
MDSALLQVGAQVSLTELLQPYLRKMAVDPLDPRTLGRRAVRTLRSWQRILADAPQTIRPLLQQQLTESSKKICAWAAIIFAPTLIGTVYGMNFDHMPELHWVIGYPLALLAMVLVSIGLYLLFRRRKWL